MVAASGGSLAPTVYATPFDGNHVHESLSHYMPLWSTADHIYVAQPVTILGVIQARACRLNKSYVAQEDVQIGTTSRDSGNPGHRGCAVASTDDGKVFTFPEGHNAVWDVRTTTAANDLSTLTPITDPTGGMELAYQRFFRNPNNGDLYMVFRDIAGYTVFTAHIWKWNGTAWAAWASPIATQNGILGGPYCYEMAFGADGTIYVAVEFVPGNAGSGYPRQNLCVIKTTDGTNWTTMAGAAVTLPIDRDDITPALPDEVVVSQIVMGANDRPVLLAAHRDYRDSVRDLWVARWDGSGWDAEMLVEHTVGGNIGNVNVAAHGAAIVASYSRFDTFDDGGWPSGTYLRPGPLNLLVSTDGGATWTTYTLDDGTTSPNFWGAYLDPHSLRLDGVVRLLPLSMDTPSKSEVWEVALPA